MRFIPNQFTQIAIVTGLMLASLGAQAGVAERYNFSESDSQIIKFDKGLKRAMIANSDLATVKVLNKKELLITGKSAGRTQLIVTYRDSPRIDHQIVLNVGPDQSRREEIQETLVSLLKDLNPQGSVQFALKNIWVNSESSIRREVDRIGNQIDADADVRISKRKDQGVLQSETVSGKLSIQPLAGNYMVILSGDVPNKAQKKRIHSVISALGLSVVNMIKVTGPQQIKLSVRVAEVVKGNPFNSGASAETSDDKRDLDFAAFLPNQLSGAAGLLLAAADNSSHGTLSGLLTVLESNNLARVLAKPELIVQSGETAQFLVGGEVPIPVSQKDGVVTVEYKEFGIRLRFSPIITESGDIQMTVAPEISNIDANSGHTTAYITVPGFRSRKAMTTVTLAAGQSFVIGGLTQDLLKSSISKVPILGDIPILGALFRSTSYEKDQSELAILVTPTFVEPISKDSKISLPGENMGSPSVADGFFMGKLAELLPEGQSALAELSVKIGLETP